MLVDLARSLVPAASLTTMAGAATDDDDDDGESPYRD
jgi:hypothetical protein